MTLKLQSVFECFNSQTVTEKMHLNIQIQKIKGLMGSSLTKAFT